MVARSASHSSSVEGSVFLAEIAAYNSTLELGVIRMPARDIDALTVKTPGWGQSSFPGGAGTHA